LTFKRSGLSCYLRNTRMVRAFVVDGPRGGFQPAVCLVIHVFSFDPFGHVLLVAQGLADSPRGECGRSSPRGRSAGRARTVHFSRCSTGGSGGYFRRFAVNPRTVRQAPADSPPGPCERSALGTANCLLCFLSCASMLF
jgi:hypothetical protein